MKLQFLGDSKDCFKWDYHDFLMRELGYEIFTIAFMLTKDEKNSHGQTKAEIFPADRHIVDFCDTLKKKKDPNLVANLPNITGAAYKVHIHRPSTYLTSFNRYPYFQDINAAPNQIFFLDPDNGFEPEKSSSEKHVTYQDIHHVLDQAHEDTLVSVFHHFRRIRFTEDYRRIRERLVGLHSTAIAWNNSLMFVGVAKSATVIEKALSANQRYAQNYPKIVTM